MTKSRPGVGDVGSPPRGPRPPAPVRDPLLLLILARNERGLTVREETDLATAAEDILDTAGLGDRRVHATLEPAVISGDPVLAERLIANLVDNALRYNTAVGDIWISTRTTAGSSQLTVANTGPVISPADAAASSSRSSGSATARPRTAAGSAWPSSRPSPRSTAAPSPPAPAMTAACPSRSRSPRPAPRPMAPAFRHRTTRCPAPRLTRARFAAVRANWNNQQAPLPVPVPPSVPGRIGGSKGPPR